MANARHFKTLNQNRTWDVLQEANQMHVTAGQRYLYLVKDLETQCVSFSDIGNFILNEAKRAGVYRKINGQYASKTQLKKQNEAWFVAYKNFMAWLNYNYAGSYDKVITSAMRAEARDKRKAEKAQRKTTAITRSSADGSESRTEVVETSGDMDAPLENVLSADQIAAIVLNNLGILGDFAAEKGAGEEYNVLMDAIGKTEFKLSADEMVQ